jgi:hypothetical protein
LESLLQWVGYVDAEFTDAKFAVPAFEECEFDRSFGEHAPVPNILEFPHISSFFVKRFSKSLVSLASDPGSRWQRYAYE